MDYIKRIFVFLFAFSFHSITFAADSEEWLLTDVSLVDVKTGEVNKDASIWIKNGKIKAVNPTSTPKKIKKISAYDRWVIPGLSEMHAHVPGNPEYSDRIMKLFIAHGVTNIRGMLGQPVHLELRKQLNSGYKLGPYLVTSGPSVNGNSVQSPEIAKKTIKEQVAAGYDFHKIHPGLSKESYKVVSETAKKLGSNWGGHISLDVGIIDTIKLGQSTIDHMDGFIEELAVRNGGSLENQGFFGFALAEKVKNESIAEIIKELSAYDYSIVATEGLMQSLAGESSIDTLMKNPALRWMPQSVVSNWKSSHEGFWNNESVTKERAKRFLEVRSLLLKEFQNQGVPILLGSDAPQIFNVPGDSLHKEMVFMVEAGLTPLEVLQSGTKNVYEHYKGKHPVGLVAPGMRADLVLLDNNPLEDIRHTRDIYAIVSAGQLLDRKNLDEILKSLE